MSNGDSKTLIIAPAEKMGPFEMPVEGVTAFSWEEFNAGKYAELSKYDMVVASPYYTVEPTPVDEYGLTPHLTALPAYFQGKSTGIFLVPSIDYLIAQPSERDVKKFCGEADNWSIVWPGIWKTVIRDITIRQISFCLGAEFSVNFLEYEQNFAFHDSRFENYLRKYFERHPLKKHLPQLTARKIPKPSGKTPAIDVPDWTRSEFAATKGGMPAEFEKSKKESPKVMSIVSCKHNINMHAALLVVTKCAAALVLPICDVNINMQDLKDFLEIKDVLQNIVEEQPLYEPLLEIDQVNRRVICSESNIRVHAKTEKITADQDFTYLCIVAEAVPKPVLLEQIVVQIIERLHLDSSSSLGKPVINRHKLRFMKNRIKTELIAAGAPQDLVDFILPDAKSQGQLLRAEIAWI